MSMGNQAAIGATSVGAQPGGNRPESAASLERILEIEEATHAYDGLVALDQVSVSAGQGEFLTLLGPSGSGKTTLLKIIAGLEDPTRIRALRIAGEDVRGVPANHRNVVTVFQHYALFPHMTVGENVEYGLRLRGVTPADRRKKALDALDLVRLPDKYGRRIHQLSGGERQRVALARALVVRPAILLLDEPLGALDEKLRVEMQVELQQLQRSVGTTFVYVTHSQEEALTMSDRIVLLNRGRVEQEGDPRSLYERPASRFVAEFMGIENVIEGVAEGYADGIVSMRAGDVSMFGVWHNTRPARPGDSVVLAVRAQTVNLAADKADVPDGSNCLACKPRNTLYKGKYLDFVADSPIGPITARLWTISHEDTPPGFLWWRTADCAIAPVG